MQLGMLLRSIWSRATLSWSTSDSSVSSGALSLEHNCEWSLPLSLYLSHPHTHTHLHTLTHTLTHTLSIALERMDIAKIQWSPSVGGLFSGFGVSLFLFYSLTPWVIRMSSAVVFNLSLLTADFYSLIFGLFLFHYKVRVCVCVFVCACVCVLLLASVCVPSWIAIIR